jgi:branched-chain amino acid transport system substrate-binding protein
MKYQSGDQDFTAQLTEIISKAPDIVFIPAYFAEGAIILKQARELGATSRFMGGDAMDNPEIVTLGGDAVEGFLHTTFAYDPSMQDMNPVAQKFTENWKAEFPGKEPNVNAALGYDAYVLVVDAIKRAGSAEPEKIRDALEQAKDIPTVTGLTTMNATHDAEKELGIVEIRDGKKQFIETVTPEA